MINFCSHFDRNYLTRAMALYESMCEHVTEFTWYVCALDQETYAYLMEHKPRLIAARLESLENDELRRARQTRTWQEYVWTLTPFVISAAMRRHGFDNMTYLDADSFFFGDPTPLIRSFDGADIAITPHRFAPGDVHAVRNGTYNVNFVYFHNTLRATMCLQEWARQCLQWCHARSEDGKFGDQGYLDVWPQKYGARTIDHVGINLAPWNQMRYEYMGDDRDSGKVFVAERSGHNLMRLDQLVLYHFHEWSSPAHRTNWPLRPEVVERIYKPYEKVMGQINVG